MCNNKPKRLLTKIKPLRKGKYNYIHANGTVSRIAIVFLYVLHMCNARTHTHTHRTEHHHKSILSWRHNGVAARGGGFCVWCPSNAAAFVLL